MILKAADNGAVYSACSRAQKRRGEGSKSGETVSIAAEKVQ